LISPTPALQFLKEMKMLMISLLLFSSSVSWAFDGAKPPESYEGKSHPTVDLEKPDLAESDDKVAWRMWYISKGTRSEGLHGAILNNQKPIAGTKVGDTKIINGKEYVWCGTWNSRQHLFSLSGWLPKSEDRVRSWLANSKKAEKR
jgi:hypothetical protein